MELLGWTSARVTLAPMHFLPARTPPRASSAPLTLAVSLCLFSCAGGELLDDAAGVCGDGVRQSDEQCDDGNTRSGDGCNSRCESEGGGDVVCGDGLIGGRESCDDGDVADGDGCSALCGVEDGFGCTGEPSVCTPSIASVCGDGAVGAGEACDDGGAAGGDGCSATCSVEDGWECVGAPSVCSPVSTEPQCGDGRVQGDEGCDDGNLRAADGCSPACNVEAGFTCEGSPSVCDGEPVPSTCGDGVVEGAETCDDGGRAGGDGCTGNCFVEDGYECSGTPSVCVSTVPVCGNGAVEDGEDCDDGDVAGGDGCGAGCEVEADWTCAGSPSVCTPPDRCAGVDCSGLDTACAVGVCSALTGLCELTARDDGTSCDDGDPCTTGDACRDGACDAGAALDCSSLTSPCGTGVCDPDAGGCVAVPAAPGATCDTNPNDCVTAVCEEGLCVEAPLPDCSACGAGSLCAAGECVAINPVTSWGFEAATPPPEFRFTGSPSWALTTAAWADGARSLRSGAIGGGGSTTATLQVTVNRAVTLRFAYAVSSEATFDVLTFTIDGTEQLRDSGDVDWTDASFPLAAGTHTLAWTYSKDGWIVSGADAAYIDTIVLDGADTCLPDSSCGAQLQTQTTCLTCPDAAAADGPCDVDSNACTVGTCTAGVCVEPRAADCSACPGGTCLEGVCRDRNQNVFLERFEGDTAPGFRVGGRDPWAIWDGAGRDGGGAARSGDLAGLNSVESWAEIVVTLPAAGSLEFWYRVSSETGYDWLELLVNGSRVDRWSGEVGWTRYTRALPAGAATIRWRYTKDSSATSGSDAAWIDDVRVSVPCAGAAECAVSVGGADACVECPAADGAACTGGTCEAGVCQ